MKSGVPISQSRKKKLAISLPILGFGIWMVEWFFTIQNTMWAIALLLWSAGGALAAWRIVTGKEDHLLDHLERNAERFVIGFILLFAIGMIGINVVQWHYFSFGAYPEDLAYYNQVLWNTLHGDFLIGNVQQERLYNPPLYNDFGMHVSPALLLGILPVYAIIPHVMTLQVILNLAIASAAWPLFLFARERVGNTGALCTVVLYLFNPAVYAQGFGSFTLLSLAPLPIFYALLSFDRRQFTAFLCWMGVALAIREEIAITFSGFAVWAFLERRNTRWLATCLAIPVMWWGFTTLVVMPSFGRSGNSALDAGLAGGKKTSIGIYEILLGNPYWILEGFRKGGLKYLYLVNRSVSFLAFFGKEGVLALPGLASTLFLSRVNFSGSDPFSRFALLTTCTLIGATVITTSRICRRGGLDLRVFPMLLLIFLPSVSLLDGAKDFTRERFLPYWNGRETQVIREGISLIPESASVAAPTYTLPALSSRNKLYALQYLHMYPPARIDYFLLDRDLDRMTTNSDLRLRYGVLLERLSRDGEYETVWKQGDFSILRLKKGTLDDL